MKELTRLCVTYSLFAISLFAWCAYDTVRGESPQCLSLAMLFAGTAWGVWLCLPGCSSRYEDTERLSRIVLGLAERVAAQSELLGRKAERDSHRCICETCKALLRPDEESCYLDTRDGEKWYCAVCAMDHDWGDEAAVGSQVSQSGTEEA
jgi:RNase P subunit RPR2